MVKISVFVAQIIFAGLIAIGIGNHELVGTNADLGSIINKTLLFFDLPRLPYT